MDIVGASSAMLNSTGSWKCNNPVIKFKKKHFSSYFSYGILKCHKQFFPNFWFPYSKFVSKHTSSLTFESVAALIYLIKVLRFRIFFFIKFLINLIEEVPEILINPDRKFVNVNHEIMQHRQDTIWIEYTFMLWYPSNLIFYDLIQWNKPDFKCSPTN